MSCPECKSDDVMIRTETSKRENVRIGFFWVRKESTLEEKTTRRCLGCGWEWEGEE